ncbi:ATP-dependent RNA helicase DEAH12, chloroplastic [Aplysia californica]|uniref:ATP-dependent RNA helicase DEAH12, chloroplastic n=1 Tax=Aplysia californica TaxID=6500 RepID=A0ABM0JRH7_APLCA|nr:ATP-dependent RNA helicase DEAH12, chloroplastic [Aplysia californica]
MEKNNKDPRVFYRNAFRGRGRGQNASHRGGRGGPSYGAAGLYEELGEDQSVNHPRGVWRGGGRGGGGRGRGGRFDQAGFCLDVGPDDFGRLSRGQRRREWGSFDEMEPTGEQSWARDHWKEIGLGPFVKAGPYQEEGWGGSRSFAKGTGQGRDGIDPRGRGQGSSDGNFRCQERRNSQPYCRSYSKSTKSAEYAVRHDEAPPRSAYISQKVGRSRSSLAPPATAQNLSKASARDKECITQKRGKWRGKSNDKKCKDDGFVGGQSQSCVDLSTVRQRQNLEGCRRTSKVKDSEPNSSQRMKTEASLRVKDSFTDAESVKNVILENFSKRENLELEFVEDSIVSTRERTACSVILYHRENLSGGSVFAELCKTMKDKVNTEVTYYISRTYKEGSVKNTDFVNEESDYSDASQSAKTVNCKNKKRRSRGTSKVNAKGDVNTDTSSQNKSGPPAKPVPSPVPTTLSIRIEKSFKDTDAVRQYLLEKIEKKKYSFEIVPNSINIRKFQTYCELKMPSKAAAERLRNLLNGCKEVKIFNGNKIKKAISDAQRNSMKRDIQRESALIFSHLTQHDEKIKKFEDSIVNLERKSGKHLSCRSESEILVLKDKLEEAVHQKDTFQEQCTKMISLLEDLSTSTMFCEDQWTKLLRSISIECKRLSNALPMYARKNDILDVISANKVSVVLGETGSGKSTQMAQYIYESDINAEGMIVCTQPRKITARTLAERVAFELTSTVGNLVGYITGAQKCIGPMTKIVFTTDHSLLNEFLKDPDLRAYSCIIVDEAHERSIYTDILLGMIKSCSERRPELKVIITSATINPEIFINYFPNKPTLLQVSGRTFPVNVVYESADETQDFDNIEEKAVSKVVSIHKSKVPGDILVFLTSAVEIMRCCEETKKRLKDPEKYQCLPLHGQLPAEEQQEVFKQLDVGVRKIVFATNCAETSVTIDGIKFVIDPGVAKEMKYDPKKNISLLGTHIISQSSANQRKGRAGRTASGTCYRLYTEKSFLTLATSSEPEILRVHLGQAVLKLAELGVNARSYDFVEPPSREALDTAVSTLREIGALLDDSITETGRFISRLPFDPGQGLLVFLGHKDHLLYDAVVIAALLSNGSDIFYRGLTDVEEQNSARNKNQFASQFGDPFTWFNVYKEWSSAPKKQQSAWCKEHSVDNKVMNYTRQCVRDVADVLRKEHRIHMEENFSDSETAVDRLRKMVFTANLSMVGHFLGHQRAGYYATGIQRQVHFHPSSSLMSQNAYPEWIVYSQFVKSSRDFIKGITVIDEAWVQEAVNEKQLAIDIAEVKGKQSRLVHREEAGKIVFRALVGPRFQNLMVLEDCFVKVGMETVVVEAHRDLGTVDVFSSSPRNQNVIRMFNSYKEMTLQELQSREQEFSVNKSSKNEQGGCRVMLGQGAEVKLVLMPGQSTKVLIKNAPDTSTVEDVRDKFSVYGEIKDCFRFKCEDPWGLIRFATCSEAEKAANETKDHEVHTAVLLKTDGQRQQKAPQFQARLSWCRRPVKGRGTAFIKCQPDVKRCLLFQPILLNLRTCTIKESNKGEDLVVFNTGNTSEDIIKDKILELLRQRGEIHKSLEHEIRVFVVRENIVAPTEEEMSMLETAVLSEFDMHLQSRWDTCTVDLKHPRDKDIKQIGFVYFNNPVSGFRACQRLQGILSMDGRPVEISPKLKTSIHIPRKIMEASKLRFDDHIQGLTRNKETEVTIVPLKQGDFRLDISSPKAECIALAREVFQTELEGDVIECGRSALRECLLSRQGLQEVHKVEESADVLIVVNQREKQLHLYGQDEKMSKAKMDLNTYLSRLADGREECINLKAKTRPPGLMKALLLKYGHTLDGLQNEFQLNSVKIDFKLQKISLVGKDEALRNCTMSIEELSKDLAERSNAQSDTELPDCVVCMCPVETSSDLYRLEGCGHGYCTVCIKLQVSVSVQDKQFPMSCAHEGCGQLLVWKDIDFFLKKKWIAGDKLAQMALNAYVEQQPDKYKFCSTPNCPVVYEVTHEPQGCVFTCPSCYASVCSSCNKASHAGLTCEMAKSLSNAEKELERWTKENPEKRKICPGCRGPVEKIYGCNKMHCSCCRVIFCWLCLKRFPTETLCYAHLRSAHGGIF